MSPRVPRIALISAVPTAIPAAVSALGERFPEAEVWNLLDDRLLEDAKQAGGLNDSLRLRMRRLIEHAVSGQADGVLLTCSLYGPVAQEMALDIPVLAPDQAAFEALSKKVHGRILVVASFREAMEDSVMRLRAALSAAGSDAAVSGLTVDSAMTATRNGDGEALIAALVEACRPVVAGVDAIFLAQYSLAPAAAAVQQETAVPVFSGPSDSADFLRETVGG